MSVDCKHEVIIIGEPLMLDYLQEIKFDFEKIRPTPREFLNTSQPNTNNPDEMIAKYGYSNRGEWIEANWGAYMDFAYVEREDDRLLSVYFESRNSLAVEILRYVSKKYGVKIILSCDLECLECVILSIENGEVIDCRDEPAELDVLILGRSYGYETIDEIIEDFESQYERRRK